MIQVKFLVDKEERKVVFGESGKEFVDVLLSFLTLPLGTVVRLLGKQSSLGCFDGLYKSVENLDIAMLTSKLRHARTCCLSAAGVRYEDLAARINETDHRNICICSQSECFKDVF